MGIKYEVVSRILSSAAADRSKLPITVYVGYPWPKLAAVRPRKDEVWDFIRDKVKTAAEALAKTQSNRSVPRLPVRVNRLRARHGGSVLDALPRRVDEVFGGTRSELLLRAWRRAPLPRNGDPLSVERPRRAHAQLVLQKF